MSLRLIGNQWAQGFCLLFLSCVYQWSDSYHPTLCGCWCRLSVSSPTLPHSLHHTHAPHHVSLRRLNAFRPNHYSASISMTSNCSLYMKILNKLASVQLWVLSVVSNMNKWFIDVDRFMWVCLTAVIKGFLNVLSASAWLSKFISVPVAEQF